MRIWNTSTPWVSCDDCLANTAYGDTKEEAIEQWNRRADKLEGQPTAYDPDKAVEQLEDYGNEEMHYYKGTPYEKCIEECIGKAIEIVKGGGVDGN